MQRAIHQRTALGRRLEQHHRPPALAPDIAVRAGLLRARHYRRRDRAVSLAGCVAAETARALDAPLATSDPHLLDTCAAEGIAVVVLPDARGSVWTG